jgi:hypothetical protein
MPARAYSSRRAIASAQKCGGVNDQKQQERVRIDVTGHGRPAEHRRSRSRRSADDDVL